MNGISRVLAVGSLAIATAIGCSSSVTDPDSETHWLRKCDADADCGPGLSCLCNTCTRACQASGCRGLGASAACVTLTPSGSDSCQMAPGVAFCTTACSNDADCRAAGSNFRCIGGACLAGPVHGAPTSPSTWVTDVLDAWCARAVRCAAFPDGATCKASRDSVFPVDGFNSASAAITAVSNGTATFDSTAATSCLNVLSHLDCGVEFWAPSSTTAPCDAAFSGSVPDGGACIDDVECAKGSLCDTTGRPEPVCGGTCTPASDQSCRANTDCSSGEYCIAGLFSSGSGFGSWGGCDTSTPPGANPGDPCGTPTQCAPGLSCSGGPAPALCGPAASIGESCGGFVGPSCAPGLACVGSINPNPGTCMPVAKLGDSCTSLLQCGAQYEMSDIICDTTGSHTCVHRPATGSCVLMSGVNTCDPTVSYCDDSTGVGTCKPWLSSGAPCVFPTNGFDPCGPGNSCQGSGDSARCTSLQPCTLD
jgi:hypothetical protein